MAKIRNLPYAYRRDIDLSLDLDENNDLKMVTDVDAINQSIYTILSSNFGDKIMDDRQFGANLESVLFSNNDVSGFLIYEIKTKIQQAIERYEPDVTGVVVQVSYDDAHANSLGILVSYMLRDGITNGQFQSRLFGENGRIVFE